MDIESSVKQCGEKKLLRDIRKEMGLSQSEMAEALGINRARISDIERGEDTPDWLIKAIRLNKLINRAGYTLDDILINPTSDE